MARKKGIQNDPQNLLRINAQVIMVTCLVCHKELNRVHMDDVGSNDNILKYLIIPLTYCSWDDK